MKPHATRHTPLVVTLGAALALTLGACPDDAPTPTPDATADTTADTDEPPDAADTADPTDADTSSPGDTADTTGDTHVPPFEWPWPAETIAIPAHDSWKERVAFPTDPFLSAWADWESRQPRWIKFTVFTGDPTRVIFQHSGDYPLHYPFALERLPQFAGLAPHAFDEVTLFNPNKRAILGALLYAPDADVREVAVQLASRDALDPHVVDVVIDLVAAAIDPASGEAPPTMLYFPSFEQAPSVAAAAATYAALGVHVDTPLRWAGGDLCYAPGWAIGRLVHVPGADIATAWLSGALRSDDILFTDGVPAEVPHVAGIISLTASTPNSHVALLAQNLDIPFVTLATPASAAAAEALVGRVVVLRAFPPFVGGSLGACEVDVIDVDGLIDAADRDAILALKAPLALDLPPRASPGVIAATADALTAADARFYGGKAANFGLLRRALPDNSPSPAVALSFDLWDGLLDQPVANGASTLRAAIAALLAGHTWPPDVAALQADLLAIQALFTDDVQFTAAAEAAVLAALTPFDPDRKIRFRSSTNVEDTAHFTGAGLYDSYSGCLADDLDGDAVGPSRCDATEPKERGVFRAIKKVYASFYNLNAFLARLRHGVDEADVGMAVLVHHSFPDEIELANGVAVFHELGWGARYAIVSQPGAHSVTNPEGDALPEVVDGDRFTFGRYFTVQRTSTLLPLGQTVLAWEDGYHDLADLIDLVGAAWGEPLPQSANFILDLEYKLEIPDKLVIKQVRPLPLPDRVERVPTFLLPTVAPQRLCTFQGEYGSVMGNHRAKLRLLAHTGATWLGDDGTPAQTFYSAIDASFPGQDGALATLTGSPTAWPGFAHKVAGDDVALVWSDGADATLRTFALTTAVRRKVSPEESPLLVLGDLSFTARLDHATPQLEVQPWSPPTTVTTDYVQLSPCPPDGPVPGETQVTREAVHAGVTVTIDLWWPPAPTGVVAGYTAPLQRWGQTTITGLTTEPIVLTGYWSQTYRPGHHNFSEEFVFEPAREPGLSAATLAELAEADIALIYVSVPSDVGAVKLAGADGKLRDPGAADR